MAALAFAPEIARDPQPPFLAMLRLAALECRIAPRAGAPTAEILRVAAIEDMVTMLARTLPSLLERRPIVWRPGTGGRSFDEAWLLALLEALRTGDRASERFLLARRARPEGAPVLRMLMGDIASRLDGT